MWKSISHAAKLRHLHHTRAKCDIFTESNICKATTVTHTKRIDRNLLRKETSFETSHAKRGFTNIANLDILPHTDKILELTFKSQESDCHIWWKCVTTLTVLNFIPQNAISLQNL